MHTHGKSQQNEQRTAAAPTPGKRGTAAPGLPQHLFGPRGIGALQGTAGNAAVVQLLSASAGAAQEVHEHGAGCGHEQDAPPVQRSAVPDVLRSSGRPLDAPTRTDMEARLGADFGDVRIHDDSRAQASAAEIGARAYTSGNNVVIGAGGGDRHTLAHELTHVVQQRQGPVAGTDNGQGLKVSDPGDRFEREAEANAARALAGPAPEVQRAAEPGESAASVESGASARTGVQTAVQRFLDPAVAQSDAEQARTYIHEHARQIIGTYTKTAREESYNPDLSTQEALKEVSGLEGDEWKAVGRELARAAGGGQVGAGLAPQRLRTMVEILNRIEQRNQTHTTARADTEALKFGTEFTFTDPKLRELVPPDGDEKEHLKKERKPARDYAYGVIDNWTGRVLARKTPGVRVAASAVSSGVKAPGKAVRFTYTKGDEVVFHWTLDVDNSCLETQTMPSTGGHLNSADVSQIIQHDIFGVARSLRLETDVTARGGSGHISVDVATAFGGSVTLFLRTVEDLQKKSAEWVNSFHANPAEGYDKVNSPWLSDLAFKPNAAQGAANPLQGLQTLVSELIAEAQEGRLNIAGAAQRLQQFDARLTNPAVAANDPRGAHILSEMSHYQAINTEHAGAEGSAARLELRDVPAQTGLERLNADLERIKAMVMRVRTAVRG
ncbi:eCIS core domain-containing protein [Streptomyces sp. CA2R106]|uniref:eCIS core domain-containing protein n=1 Tax=Streptomyces sp. CA2R106 TaxID=3120153 RepID=UPI003FA69554